MPFPRRRDELLRQVDPLRHAFAETQELGPVPGPAAGIQQQAGGRVTPGLDDRSIPGIHLLDRTGELHVLRGPRVVGSGDARVRDAFHQLRAARAA